MKRNRWSRRWSANGTSRDQRLTFYKEEQVVKTTVSKREEQLTSYEKEQVVETTVSKWKWDEQKLETYPLRRGTGGRDDGQQTG